MSLEEALSDEAPADVDSAPSAAESFDVALRCAGAFVAIAIIGFVDSLAVPGLDPSFLIGSLGASAVIIFGAPESPMARARSVLGGHFVSATIGVASYALLGEVAFISGALAVALSIVAMHKTRTLHAPGGATALIANIGPAKVKALGFGYVISPVLTGALVLVLVGAALNALRERSFARR